MPQPVLQNTSCRGKRQLILKYSGIYNFVQSYLFLYLAMMKHLYYILMFTFLCLGLTAISQEEQPDSRNTTGSPAGIVVGSPASECSFTAYTQCALYTATHRSLFNDENTDCWTNEALCPNSLYTRLSEIPEDENSETSRATGASAFQPSVCRRERQPFIQSQCSPLFLRILYLCTAAYPDLDFIGLIANHYRRCIACTSFAFLLSISSH